MRRITLCLFALVIASSVRAQSPSAPTVPAHETKKERKHREKAAKAQRAEKAREAAWEAATRPPEPAYPGSVRPEFARAAAQATIIMDNAFNAISKSRMEFAIANQSSIQYSAALAAGAQSEGERQVAAILYDYAQRIPVCQEATWDALQSVLALAIEAGTVRNCMTELRRLRAQADRTFARNNIPSSPSLQSDHAPFLSPPPSAAIAIKEPPYR